MPPRVRNIIPHLFNRCVHTDSGCFQWTEKTSGRYISITVDQVRWQAHRFVFTHFNGPIPEGMVVCHSCDNTKCINPAHLFLGTQKDNIDDMVKKDRHFFGKRTHCAHGHEFTEDNTYLYMRGACEYRACKECARARARLKRMGNNGKAS